MSKVKKLQLPDLRRKTCERVLITMITCYAYSMAHLVEKAGLDGGHQDSVAFIQYHGIRGQGDAKTGSRPRGGPRALTGT